MSGEESKVSKSVNQSFLQELGKFECPECSQGAASPAALLHHGPGPEYEAVLAAHLAAALVTHAAPLPAHVRLREPPWANSGSLRGQPLEEEKGRLLVFLQSPVQTEAEVQDQVHPQEFQEKRWSQVRC